MPGEASSVGAGIALDAMSGRATQTARTTYLALLTSAPTDSSTIGTLAEITTTGYTRQAVSWTAPSGDPRESSNSATLTFGPFGQDPPNVTHAALVSAASLTTGDFIYFWTLDTARDAANGESIQVAAGGLKMTAD